MISRTGGVMYKGKNQFRCQMPEFALAQQQFESLRSFSGPFTDQTLPSMACSKVAKGCAVCAAAAANGIPQEREVKHLAARGVVNPAGISCDAVFVCSSCRVAFHTLCACSQCFEDLGFAANELWSELSECSTFLCGMCRN